MLVGNHIVSQTIRAVKYTISESFRVPPDQIARVFFHGLILACIIAAFWVLDSLKDPILANTVGIEYQPYAKFWSVATTLVVVCIYDYLTSVVNKQTLFHIVSGIFGLNMMILSGLLSNPTVGLSQRHLSPSRYIGWVCYFSVEAYGSLMVALFWSFTNSIMDLEQAKGAYGLIISIAQIGAIIGSTLATNAENIGISLLFMIGAFMIFSVSLLVKIYQLSFRDFIHAPQLARGSSFAQDTQRSENSSETIKLFTIFESCMKVFSNFYEGLSLILKHKYVFKLAGVSCLYEIVLTVLDYEFKVLAAMSSSSAPSQSVSASEKVGDRFVNLLGRFGQFTNLVSLVISCFGFSFVVHRVGVRQTLLIFPLFLFFSVVLSNLYPSLPVLFFVVSICKALTFSLQDPAKELLYIPTSEAIKYKAKAWIDVFGSRFMKAAGSYVTSLAMGDPNRLKNVSEMPCLAIALFIVVLSWMIGTDFLRLVSESEVVGEPQAARYAVDSDGPLRNGLKPGDVGYDGYDLQLFEGVFDDDDDQNNSTPSTPVRVSHSNRRSTVEV